MASDEGVNVASGCTDTDVQTPRAGGAMDNGLDLCQRISSRTVQHFDCDSVQERM